MDDLFAGIQPSGDSGAAAPAPAAEPVVPPAAEPAAPAAPAAPEAPAEPSAEEKADWDEWDKVAEDMFPGLGDTKKEDNKGEQADPTKATEEAGADKGTGEEAKPGKDAGKSDEEAETATDDSTQETSGEAEPTGPPELSASDRQQLESSVKAEISQKMFTQEVNGKQIVTTPDGSKYYLDANGKPILADKDGDPIRSIDDVMGLINPRTGKAFTEEEAGLYLLTAQNQMRDNIAEMNSRIEEIASTGLTMKEDSDMITWEYGELLKAMPEVQKELWDEYAKTLVTDPKTGIVVKAPVSLKSFYQRALEPYAELGRLLETQGVKQEQTAQQEQQEQAQKAQQQAQQRQQARQDRSDIYGGGKVDDVDDETKEWGMAAQAVFGDQLKDLRR